MVAPTVVEGTCKSVLFVSLEERSEDVAAAAAAKEERSCVMDSMTFFFFFATHDAITQKEKSAIELWHFVYDTL